MVFSLSWLTSLHCTGKQGTLEVCYLEICLKIRQCKCDCWCSWFFCFEELLRWPLDCCV